MQVAVFSTKSYDHQFLGDENSARGAPHDLRFFEPRLSAETALLAAGSEAVCAFVNDALDGETLRVLAAQGCRLIALRSAGYNHVDLSVARRLGLVVARVPAYSPHAIAEHTVALILSLNRKIHRAYARVREGNFALEGLLGFDLRGRTVGIVGTGKIGMAVAGIVAGFGCRVLAYDPEKDPNLACCEGRYVCLDELFARSDIVTLHCPLTPATRHVINARAIALMKPGVMLINTSRGAVVDTQAIVAGLKSGAIGYLGLDVYEEEADLFFEDLSEQIVQDDVFARLLTFPNVLITGHQGFFTSDAMASIAAVTLDNVSSFEANGVATHQLLLDVLT